MESAGHAYLDGLNPEQLAAVQCTEGPVLIVAGAGSGKTRVLTCRIAHILSLGTPSERIMALTFTKKAASEMKDRIAAMVGASNARRLVMGTFHSVFVRFLRQYASLLGYPETFTIYDQGDSQSAIQTCVRELGLDDNLYKPREVLSRISMAKNNLYTAAAYRASDKLAASDRIAKKPLIADIYTLYEQKCRQAGVMDFDDILLNMNILLRDHPAALEEIASRFDYLLVDEYQDTNYAQYLILKKLALHHHNVCVVGDDSQSIYAFRGAKIENILNFRKDYPECRTFRLERNYRSTRTIVGAANSLIAHNEGRIPKECYSEGEEGDKIHLARASSEREEAVLVTSSILSRMRSAGASYSDFAILYRTNAQSRALEESLRTRNVPYIIYSGNSFYERAEVKDLMAWFKLCVNPDDDESLRRAVGKPARGIGDTSMLALAESARNHGVSLWKAAWAEDNASFGLKPAGEARIRQFCALVGEFNAALRSTPADELAKRIADKSGIYALYKSDTSIEGQARLANIEELVSSVSIFMEERREEIAEDAEAGGFGAEETVYPVITLDEYLENVSLLSNVDSSEEGEDLRNKVALMTVHSAKGLEFPYVYITGLEENLFPSGGMLASPADVEEERRLFYVALTRAGRNVELYYADSRMRNGQHNSNPPSRFIREIDPKYLDRPPGRWDDQDDDDDEGAGRFGLGGRWRFGGGRRSVNPETFRTKTVTSTVLRRETPPPPAAGFVPETDMTVFRAGDRIEHNRFGPGLIKSVSGVVPELKAQIAFDRFGDKTIMLKYAKMRKL